MANTSRLVPSQIHVKTSTIHSGQLAVHTGQLDVTSGSIIASTQTEAVI